MNNLPQIVTVVVIVITVAIGAYLLLNATSGQPSQEPPRLPIRPVVKKDVPTADPKPVSLSIPVGESGTLEHESGARIEIPAGAVEESVTASISVVESPQADVPTGVQLGKVFDISIGQAELAMPVTLHIPYEPQVGTTAEDVLALHWDEDLEGWEVLEGEVDESRSEIRVEVSDLSWFSTIVRNVLTLSYTSDDAKIEHCHIGSTEEPYDDTISAYVTNHSVTDSMYVEFVTDDPDSGVAKRLESSSASLDIDESNDFSVARDIDDYAWENAECVLRVGVPLHESMFLQPAFGGHRLAAWLAPEVHRLAGELLSVQPPNDMTEFLSLHQKDRCTQRDSDADLQAACDLAQMYAPVLRMHHDERFLPRGVEGFVTKARVMDGNDATIVPRGDIAGLDELASDTYDENHYLDVPDNIEDSTLHPSTVYWTIRDGGDIDGVEGRLYLQYYLFYHYDELNPEQQAVCSLVTDVEMCLPHEADWELIQLEFAADDAATVLGQSIPPDRVAYSQHGWSENRSYPNTETQDGHPVAYVALGKHANYFGPSDDSSTYNTWNVCDQSSAGQGASLLPALFPHLDNQTQVLTPLTIQESPWITTMCEGVENNRWTVSIVGDVISDMGSKLLPPELSEGTQLCHETSPDARDCGYNLYFIDEDTPWVAYRGKWGESGISGPDEETRWNEPQVWARLCTDDLPKCTEQITDQLFGTTREPGTDTVTPPPEPQPKVVPPTNTAEAPFRLEWQTSAATIEPGESFTLTVRMYDVKEAGEHGGISVSFPAITDPGGSTDAHSSGVADVDKIDYTSGLSNVTFHQPDAMIYHRVDNERFPADYLLVESDDPSWSQSDDRTLVLRITPKQAGKFPIQVRGWLCEQAYDPCWRQPKAGSVTDQQGWFVDSVSIPVGTPNQPVASPTPTQQGGSSQLVDEDFSGPLDADRWLLFGSASHMQSEEVVELTPARKIQLGILLNRQPVSTSGLRVDFSFEIGGGNGADGLGFVLLRTLPEFDSIDPSLDSGGTWASRPLDGFLVAFDTGKNSAGQPPDWYFPVDDPSSNFVSLTELGAGSEELDIAHLATRNLKVPLRNSGTFDAEIEFSEGGRVNVYLSNAEAAMERTLVLDHAIEAFTPFNGYMGFIGVTGLNTDRHILRSVRY